MSIEELYAQEIQKLAPEARLRLMALIAQDLAAEIPQPAHSILELDGLGREIWQGVDAQQYVDELRGEWERGP
jgi:hypothetical protein